MKRTFITNLVLLVGLNLLVKPFYLLVVESEIQNRVGPESFGSYFALINFSFILNILLDLGTTNWNTRRIAHEGHISARHLRKMIRLRILLAGIYLLVSVIIGIILNYSTWQMFLLVILAFNQVMVSGILYIRSYLTGMHLFKRDSIVSVLDRLLLLLMMSYMLWGVSHSDDGFKVEWLVWGQTISYGLTLLVALLLVRKKSQLDEASGELPPNAVILRDSFPFALLIMLSMIGYRVDSVMLERISGSHETGIYAMGFRFFEAVNMIAYLFAVLLLPMFSRMLLKKEDIAPLLQLSFKILFSGIFIATTVCCFYNQTILNLIYDQHIADAAPVFSWLMISSLFFSMQYVTGTLITASGKMKPLIWIALGGMIYNILLNTLYIPTQGALGAAKASCFSQVVIFLAQTGVVIYQFHAGKIKELSLRTLVFMALCIGAGYFFTSGKFLPADAVYTMLLFVLTMFLSALATRMLDIHAFIQLIKSKSAIRNEPI